LRTEFLMETRHERPQLLDNVSMRIVLFVHFTTLMTCRSHSAEPLREIPGRA